MKPLKRTNISVISTIILHTSCMFQLNSLMHLSPLFSNKHQSVMPDKQHRLVQKYIHHVYRLFGLRELRLRVVHQSLLSDFNTVIA